MREGPEVVGFEWDADMPLGKPPRVPSVGGTSGSSSGVWGAPRVGWGRSDFIPAFLQAMVWRNRSHTPGDGKAIIMCRFLFLKHTIASS